MHHMKGKRKVEFWIHKDAMDIVLNKSHAEGLSVHQALEKIVLDSGGNKRIEPLKTTSSEPVFEIFREQLLDIDELVDEVKTKLKRMSL